MLMELPFKPHSLLHDYNLFSIFYGEAFLYNDVLYYYDGIDARITGYKIDGNPIDLDLVNEIINRLANQYNPQSISLESPSTLGGLVNCHYKKKYILSRPNSKYDYEIKVKIKNLDLCSLKKKNIRFARNKFIVEIGNIWLSHEHIILIKKYVKQWVGGVFYKAEFISSIYYLQSRKTSKIINCYFDNKLVGFCIVSSLSQLGIMHYLVTVNEVNGISDILYYETLKLFATYDIEAVSFGFSLNKGLYNFKLKWGGVIHWKGSYEILLCNSNRVSQYLWATQIARTR